MKKGRPREGAALSVSASRRNQALQVASCSAVRAVPRQVKAETLPEKIARAHDELHAACGDGFPALTQASLANIDSVMVAGQWRKRGGRVLDADIGSLLESLQQSGRKITQAMGI